MIPALSSDETSPSLTTSPMRLTEMFVVGALSCTWLVSGNLAKTQKQLEM